jgi:hypothetical protein
MSRKLPEAGGKALYLKKLLQAHTNGEDSAQPELIEGESTVLRGNN